MKSKEQKRGFPVKIGILLLTMLAAIYFGTAFYFNSHFLPSTSLNGHSISGKSIEQVERMITEEINGYSLTIETRGEPETLNGTDISVKPEFGGSIQKLLKMQNPFAWPMAFASRQDFTEETIVSFDKDKLKERIKEFSFIQEENQTPPKDAYCSAYSKEGYKIIPEELGTKIKKKRLRLVLKDSVSSLKETVSLGKEGCYVTPKVTSSNQGLSHLVDTLNKYTGVTITYKIGDKQETLDGSITNTWMNVNNMEISINEQAVEEYVTILASAYNTVFRKHTLATSYGKTVEITSGDYGWKVDKEGEKAKILEDIKNGESYERELTYAQTANSHGEHDYGDTYVEINLTTQHLFFYKNGSLVVESDFVSGNLSKNYDTPTGIYGLTYKERDAVLRGENYASPVDYWMPYCNNVGMHDASWRSSFGGNIYKTSGSHGCVNLPPAAAKKIFENIEDGDPVIVYTLPGTESPAAVAKEAAQVVNMINGIGEVTLESEPAIAAARKLYNLLPPSGQAQVANYDLLLACEAQLAALKAQAAPPPEAPVQ